LFTCSRIKKGEDQRGKNVTVKTREGTKSGRGCLRRIKYGGGINDRHDKSRGIEILMAEVFIKINPKNCFYYYESIKRELKRRLIYEYRCDERLKTKTEESTRIVDTGLVVELEHLKIKTRLIDEKFTSVRGECKI
jgi:hypothetical protein